MFLITGQLLPPKAVTRGADKGQREARKGGQADEGRGSHAEHRIYVYGGSSAGREERSSKAAADVTSLHTRKGKDCTQPTSREALAADWVGSDSNWCEARYSSGIVLVRKGTRICTVNHAGLNASIELQLFDHILFCSTLFPQSSQSRPF